MVGARISQADVPDIDKWCDDRSPKKLPVAAIVILVEVTRVTADCLG
jgi:hypothetical protein